MKKQNKEQTYNQAAAQTYCFEFGTDEKLYSVSFKGIISKMDISRMLRAAHTNLYVNCSEAIRSYLDACSLKYSDFISSRVRLEHDAVMAAADSMLCCRSSDSLDKWIGSADEYYGILDHQCQMNGNCCEGCYFAVSRTSSRQSGCCEYHIIGQTFRCGSGKEQSCFAIRQSMDGNFLRTLDEEEGCPVLSTFGCVDVINLLLDIACITTKEQAARIAHR